ISVFEAAEWVKGFDSWQRYWDPGWGGYDDPTLSPNGGISYTTTLEYPTIIIEDIDSSISLSGIIGIPIDIHITSGATLSFENNSLIYLLNASNLIVDENASIVIQDSVTFISKADDASLIIYGNLQIDKYLKFIAEEDASLYFYIENDSLTLTIDSAYFENMFFEEKTYACTIDNSEFRNSMIKGSADYFLLSSSELTNTPVRLSREKSQDTCIARVEDCIILYDEAYRINDTLNPPSAQDHLAETLIGVEQYHHFLILNDSIVHDELDGIKLYYAGSGLVNKIKDCHIHFSGDVSTDTSYGLIIYKSYVDVQKNYIDEHTTGVACLDKSNIKINSVVRDPDEDDTQHII
ncbi:MAG: hypothetical protein KAG99_02395, partial [Bacteroidales bacterium]|nr:hypothetical protein [Bacteroidales bacterium]